MQYTRKYDSVTTEPEDVSEFTEWLARLDLADWLMVASAADEGAPARSTAFALVEALIGHLGLGMQAWSILDDVATVSHHGDGESLPLIAAGRLTERLRVARDAANAAALALLVRALLDREDFDVLYHPFSVLAPA